ncbi:MAG: DUF933 domain-containing protein, partial [Akkermansia sp.]|nr:DUF933 domain-containing protein [Akkermansia sp.]
SPYRFAICIARWKPPICGTCRAASNFWWPLFPACYLPRISATDSEDLSARETGQVEGKDYVMQDGDVVEFRFNVSK